MIQKCSFYNVLKVFLDSPLHNFQVREISRLINLAPTSVKLHLDELEKEGLVSRHKRENYNIHYYKAERENPSFILWKKISIIYELHQSGLADFLWEKLSPDAIILYGSFCKGESTEESDVDIFILGKEKNLSVKEYEKKINKRIHLMFSESFSRLSNEMKNNLINGVMLKGYLKIF